MAKGNSKPLGVIGSDRRIAASGGGLLSFLPVGKRRQRTPWNPASALKLPELGVPLVLQEKAERAGHAEVLRVCKVLDAAFPDAAFQPAESPAEWLRINLQSLLPKSGSSLSYSLELRSAGKEEDTYGFREGDLSDAICAVRFRSHVQSETIIRLAVGSRIVRLERESPGAGEAFYGEFIGLICSAFGCCNPVVVFDEAANYHWHEARDDESFLKAYASEETDKGDLPLSPEIQQQFDRSYKPSTFISKLNLPKDGDWSWVYDSHRRDTLSFTMPKRAVELFEEIKHLQKTRPNIFELTDDSHSHTVGRYLSEFVIQWDRSDHVPHVYDEVANLEFQAGETDMELACAFFATPKKLIEGIKRITDYVRWTKQIVDVVEKIRRMPQ